MDLHLLSDDERRALCRRELEALEHWLRRLIHETLSAAHGADYLEATDQGGRRVIKKPVADGIADRLKDEQARYHRRVDAALLDDLVTIICNPSNWRQYFGAALSEAFPLGNEEARCFLKRLIPIRNKLSHANPISVHEAARVICYTLDVIQALKGYYEAKPGEGVQCSYNHPSNGLFGTRLRCFWIARSSGRGRGHVPVQREVRLSSSRRPAVHRSRNRSELREVELCHAMELARDEA